VSITSPVSGVNTTSHTEYSEHTVQNGEQQSGPDFSSVLADIIREETTRVGIAAGAGVSGMPGMPGMPSGFMPVQNHGLEEMILSAASSGQTSDAQAALLMLCIMMQTSMDGAFSMMMQIMASMLSQLQGDTEDLRKSVMLSDYDPYVLDTIDRGVFGTRISSISNLTGNAVLPIEFWKPTTPSVTSNEDNRSPERYRSVINQFRVETAERYRPQREGNTYCNIFVWDVTSAMGAEIPHYTDPVTGEARYYPDIRGARSMGAIATCSWLATHGESYGWREVDAETAQMHANQGRPAITSAGSIGHVQIVCPSLNGEYDPVKGVTIAQAGSRVTNYTHISSIYGANTLKNNIRYWIHD